jgi:MFS family permease
MRQGPLAGRYPAVATMVMFALIPYLALSAALEPLTPIIAKQLHMSLQTMSLSSGMGNAAYAVGTVLAVQFAQHLPQRRMLVGYAVLLVIGSVLTAVAQNAGMFIAGHVIQGLCTSLLLIAAVPPLAIGYPASKLRTTAVIMNMCIFGAVALGPFVGGLQAEAHAWRPLFWIVAGIAAVALVLAVLTFDDAPPANPDSPRDLPAIGLAAVGCVAAFFGASELFSHPFLDVTTIVPLIVGLAAIVVLIVYQYRAKQPLLTIRTMLTSTMPVAGIALALFAAAASVSATALTAGVLAGRYSPLHIGLLYLPEVGGAVITAFALGAVITRRSMHYLPVFGMVSLAAVRQPPARVRDRRAHASGRGVHDRSDLRPLRRDGRRQPRERHEGRALDRPRARDRRSRHRRCDLRARRRACAEGRHRPLPRRGGASVVLAAAAREGPPAPDRCPARGRKREVT